MASPDLFVEELIMAFEMVGDAPLIGRLYKQSPIPDTRRVELKLTRYHVYYVPLADLVHASKNPRVRRDHNLVSACIPIMDAVLSVLMRAVR